MKELTFSNAEVKKIVDAVSKGKKWSYDVKSADGKTTWELVNNKQKSAIIVSSNGKVVDDYQYDMDEKDDVYATVLNVLDYLSNLVKKYNKKHVVNEEIVEPEVHEVSGTMHFVKTTQDIEESISKGMLQAYSKRMKEGDVHYTCKACNTNIPKYKGSYPSKCPSCGDSIAAMKENDKDEAIWGGPFKRGEVVKVKLEDPDAFYDAKLVAYDPSKNEYNIQVECGDDKGKIILGIKRKQIK